MGINFGKLPCISKCIHTETICFKMPGTYLGFICSEGFVTTVNCGNKPTAPFDLLSGWSGTPNGCLLASQLQETFIVFT